jgi:hypothetical protein
MSAYVQDEGEDFEADEDTVEAEMIVIGFGGSRR